ncbi:MAG: hypothetical protein HYX27_02015 [Acidobacteria bacterium]|nr:hypothetical protein [Acidobacteriota bacterium]
MKPALLAAAVIALHAQPQIHDDGRVIFRISAPKAAEVKLWGEWIPKYNTFEPMRKSADGTWTAEVGPIAPDRYAYLFLVDGLAVPDPKNPNVITGHDGFQGSELRIASAEAAIDQPRPGAHGVLHTHTYNSSTGLGIRRLIVYTPPGYNNGPAGRYPVVYLMHGSGDEETAWTQMGSANVIADNLIATGRMRPMIIVMPNGHASGENARERVEQDLIRDILPLIDSQYRTIPNRIGRSIAGLSMGAFQAMWYAMDHPDLFNGLGIMSGGVFGAEGEAGILRFARQKLRFRTLWITIGERDMNLSLSRRLDKLLSEHAIEHEFSIKPGLGHTWQFWRPALSELLPRLSISYR